MKRDESYHHGLQVVVHEVRQQLYSAKIADPNHLILMLSMLAMAKSELSNYEEMTK